MTVDESSSQDATLIDDDLVAALGFEPVTTIEAGGDDATSGEFGNGSAAAATDIDDSVTRDVDPSDVGESGLNGFGVDIVDDQSVDDVPPVDEGVLDEHPPAGDDIVIVDETAVDETAVEDDATDEPAVDEAVVDEGDEEGALDGEWSEQVIGDVDIDDNDVDLEGRPETDTELVVDSDLDTDTDADLEVEPDAVIDLDELDGGLDTAGDTEIDSEVDAIDDAPALAEADDVFADGELAVGEIAVGERDSDFYDYPITAPTLDGPVIGDTGMVADAGETDAVAAVAAVPAVAAPRVRRKRKIRARKSRRVIRHIDPWSVLTFSVLFHMVVFASLLLSSVLVWNAAIASGMVENVESFIQELGDYETFEINADVMFQAAIVIAGMLTLASSVMVVLLTVVFNLISDLVGGIRVTVIEEETVRVPLDKNRRDD